MKTKAIALPVVYAVSRWKRWVAGAAAAAGMALVAGTALSDTVCLATGELPPYATEQRPDQGIALEIVRRSFALAGATVHYTMKSPTAKRQAL